VTHDHDTWWAIARQNVCQMVEAVASRAFAEGYEVGLRTAVDVARKTGDLAAVIAALEAQLPSEPEAQAPASPDATSPVPMAFVTGPHAGECACGSGKPFGECHGAPTPQDDIA
jgi:hypothetical protein